MPVMQSNLPYAQDALEPYLSADAVSVGYERYYRIAVDTLNATICDTPYANLSLEQVIDRARSRKDAAIIKDASEAWNYGFSWQCMSADGSDEPTGALANLILGRFGSKAGFRSRFIAAASQNGGKGWLWLAWSRDGVDLFFAPDGVSLAKTEWMPLAVLNLSEHAYMLDFQDDPGRYAETVIDHLIDWDMADTMLSDTLYQKAA